MGSEYRVVIAHVDGSGSYEVPFGYTGVINGITVAITSVLRVTEFTP